MAYWTLVVTQTNKERFATQNLLNQGYECYLPLYREKTDKGEVAKVLFSKYLFCKVKRQWASITGTYGVSGVLMNGATPKVVPDRVLDRLKNREDEYGFVVLEEKTELKPGSTVKITDGPLKDTIGLFKGMTADERSIVLFSLLGGLREVEINTKVLTLV